MVEGYKCHAKRESRGTTRLAKTAAVGLIPNGARTREPKKPSSLGIFHTHGAGRRSSATDSFFAAGSETNKTPVAVARLPKLQLQALSQGLANAPSPRPTFSTQPFVASTADIHAGDACCSRPTGPRRTAPALAPRAPTPLRGPAPRHPASGGRPPRRPWACVRRCATRPGRPLSLCCLAPRSRGGHPGVLTFSPWSTSGACRRGRSPR